MPMETSCFLRVVRFAPGPQRRHDLDTTVHRNGAHRVTVSHFPALLTLCLAVLVAQIDTAVVNLGTHRIGSYFHASVGALQWVVDAYNLTYAVLLLTGGLLADLIGRRKIFIFGAAIFTAASIAAAFSPAVGLLIGARAVAGVGAALLIPASLAIIRVIWRDSRERGRALGIWAACNGVALALGPTLGGVLIQRFDWRSIFLVVVPVSLAAIVLAPLTLPESADPRGRSFDAKGQTFGALGLGAVAFAAIEAHSSVWPALGACAAAAVCIGLFVVTERSTGSTALVPLELFSSKPFTAASVATTAMTFGMYGVIFLLPLTWQSARGLGATAAGIALMPMALVFVIVSPFSGRLTERFGARFTTAGGVAVVGVGLLLIAMTAGQASLAVAEIGLALTGVGMGLATGPLMGEAVGAVPAARSGTASAIINVARMVGATVGVAALGAVYAAFKGGPGGLRFAMIIGGAAQLSGAAYAWSTTARRSR
jgi:MFS transporter, DHA2 family, methylenomycin A resistance protein